MTTKTLTQGTTEADLEAEIHGALRKVFPWLPASALKHQVRFSFTIGRSTVYIDGTATTAEGRTDILVYAHDKPLAVFELKRQGHALTLDDEAQGLSYAKVMSIPLVVLSNGEDTRVIEAYSGEPWEPESPSEEEFQKLVIAAGRAATGELKKAVSTLMGSNPAVWVQAVRAASGMQIDEMCGAWDNPFFPFVRDFLFPRKATAEVENLLRDGKCFILIKGSPLVGKSSLLRELSVKTSSAPDLVVLFVSADDGRGVIQTIADLLASELSWPITIEEARHWLRMISHATGPALVLAVDGIDPGNDTIRREIENLSSAAFGPQLRMIVTLDDTAVKMFTVHPNGRQASAIGRHVDGSITLGLLDDDEFELAANALWDRRMDFLHGAASALELRVPWILRAIGGFYAPRQADPPDQAVLLPPQLSFELISHARARFNDPELCRQFRELARGVLHDAEDSGLPLALELESMSTFIVRHDTMRQYLDQSEINELKARGILKLSIHDSQEPVLYVALPEFIASEISLVLGKNLIERFNVNAEEAAHWLVAIASRIPLGDIVAAHAFLDAARGEGSIPIEVVGALVNMPPRNTPASPGMKLAMHVPGLGIVEMTFVEGGAFTAEINGKIETISIDPADQPKMLADYHPWLILSHLAGMPMGYGPNDERIDHTLLGEIGSCQYVLRRPDALLAVGGILTHNIPGYGEIVCHKAGIIEPITYALFKMLSKEGPTQKEWMDKALASESLGLLARIDAVLRVISGLADQNLSQWAERLLNEKIIPAFDEIIHVQYLGSRCQ